MENKNTESILFDVFLCHNSDDKKEVRHIADELIKQGIKPWLDEREIPPGTLWQSALEEQISSIRSVAIFVGKNGIGPWQNIEIRAFINEFVERGCPVIPAILPNAKNAPSLPILLKSLHYIDFRILEPDPLMQMQWGITGKKQNLQNLSSDGLNVTPKLLSEKEKQSIELRLPGNFDDFSSADKEKLLLALSALIKIDGKITITEIRPGSVRVFLEVTPEQADKIYAGVKNGQLDLLKNSEVRLYPSIAYPPDEEQRAELLIIIDRVKEYWIDGVLNESLYRQVLIQLNKHVLEDAVKPLWNQSVELPKHRQKFNLNNSPIDTIFDATGLLLILGEPGSGKTITLLKLASILIDRAKYDSKERIPIVLNLSSWQKSQNLEEWMIAKLSNMYQVPSKVARIWLDKDFIVPLLDGLDEVKKENQPNCVEAINRYIDEVKPAAVVVCSRINDYLWLPERLKLNGAICIEPLKQEQIDSYFKSLGTESESLRIAIQEDRTLYELAQSPLMLNVMSLTYHSPETSNLNDKTLSIEQRRIQIFDAYVDKMFQLKTTSNPILPKEKVLEWLAWLASGMTKHSQSIFLVENLQPTWLENSKQNFFYKLILSLTIGLSSGLMLALLLVALSVVHSVVISLAFGLFLTLLILLSGNSNSLIINSITFIVVCLILGLILYKIINLYDYISMPFEDFLFVLLMFVAIPGSLFTGAGIGSFNTIKSIEVLTWSWKIFFEKIVKHILIFGLVGWVLAMVFSSQIESLIQEENIVINDVISEAFFIGITSGGGIGSWFGILSGLIHGFTAKIKEAKAIPNQGIILSLKNGLTVGLIVAVLTFFTYLGTLKLFNIEKVILDESFLSYLIFPIMITLYLSTFLAMRYGLNAALKHYALRFTLYLNGKTPLKLVPILNYCERLIFLKRVGGGYIFIHRMLLEYFAKNAIKNNKQS